MDGKFRLETTASQFESKTIAHAINCFVFCGFSAETNVKVFFPSKKTNQSQLSFQKNHPLVFWMFAATAAFVRKFQTKSISKCAKRLDDSYRELRTKLFFKTHLLLGKFL